MRRTIQFLFILFYVASGHAVSQERTNLIVSELQHSSSHGGQLQFDTGCDRLDAGIPFYQQVKPSSNNITELSHSPAVCPLQDAVERLLPIPHCRSKRPNSIQSNFDRAPPELSHKDRQL